jgi:hypothetical protein
VVVPGPLQLRPADSFGDHSFTLALLKAHVQNLDRERRELGPNYQDHGMLFCWEGWAVRRGEHS